MNLISKNKHMQNELQNQYNFPNVKHHSTGKSLVLPHVKTRDSSVGTVLGYGLDDQGSTVRFQAGLGIFLFTASRTALGPNQPPIQWVPGFLSLVVKRPEREADYSPPSSAEVKE
jgi:hypothetical protein